MEPAEYEGFLNFIKLLWPAEIPERETVDVQKGGEPSDVRHDEVAEYFQVDSSSASAPDDSFTDGVPGDSYTVSASDSTMASVPDATSTVTVIDSTIEIDSVQDDSSAVTASDSAIDSDQDDSSTVTASDSTITSVQVDIVRRPVDLDFIQFDLENAIDVNIDIVDNNLNIAEQSNPTKKMKVLNLPTKKRAKGVPDNVNCEICGVLIQERACSYL